MYQNVLYIYFGQVFYFILKQYLLLETVKPSLVYLVQITVKQQSSVYKLNLYLPLVSLLLG